MKRSEAGRLLGLAGYSTRALAQAAADLGFSVAAVDAFCDQDTLDVAECRIVHRWPHDVVARAQSVQCDGWLLAGGMENYGRLVAQLAGLAPVLGPTREQLSVLRSLRFWRELTDSVSALRMPATLRSLTGRHSGPARLYKPRRSSGGVDVVAAAGSLDTSQLPRGYWQEFVAGRVLGATSLIADSRVSFLGATESLSADQWSGPRPYIYRGSLGPVELEPAQRETLLAMAACVGERLGYRGYLQADLIEDAMGRLWLLELNPRWTAGMEVLHACAGEPASSPLAAHLAAFDIGIAPSDQSHLQTPGTFAKAILYAPCDLQLSFEKRHFLQKFRLHQPWGEAGWWNIADVPPLGTSQSRSILAGQPMLTLRVGMTARDNQWVQTRQTLLDGLAFARSEVLRCVFHSP